MFFVLISDLIIEHFFMFEERQRKGARQTAQHTKKQRDSISVVTTTSIEFR